ncbi:MAG: hypothetical protein LBC63_05825 [Holophagales bacterium]|jgi:hypothetical protein|nr:hypothetical protein [Holophagales bacterium]
MNKPISLTPYFAVGVVLLVLLLGCKPPTNYVPRGIFYSANEPDTMKCPICGSTHLSIYQRGYKLSTANLVLSVLIHPVFLFGGFRGRNDLKVTCGSCFTTWEIAKPYGIATSKKRSAEPIDEK